MLPRHLLRSGRVAVPWTAGHVVKATDRVTVRAAHRAKKKR